MNNTGSMAAATPAENFSEFKYIVAIWYVVVDFFVFAAATLILMLCSLHLLAKTRKPIFAFLIPTLPPISAALCWIPLHYVVHYGIVLNVFGAFRIRLWPRLAPPNCQAATAVLGSSTMCSVEEFYEWVGLAGQPGGLGKMMSDETAVQLIVVGLGSLLFWCFVGWCFMSQWNHAVREDRAEEHIRWLRRSVFSCPPLDEDEHEGEGKSGPRYMDV